MRDINAFFYYAKKYIRLNIVKTGTHTLMILSQLGINKNKIGKYRAIDIING